VRKIPLDRSSANSAFVVGHRATIPLSIRESRSATLRLVHILIELLLLLLLPGLLVALLATLSRLLLLLLTRLLFLLAALALLATLVWIAHVFPRLVSVYASSQSLAERAGSIWEELSMPIRSVRPSGNTDCKGRRVGYPGSPLQKWTTAWISGAYPLLTQSGHWEVVTLLYLLMAIAQFANSRFVESKLIP
jgi:hypothetical protein